MSFIKHQKTRKKVLYYTLLKVHLTGEIHFSEDRKDFQFSDVTKVQLE